MKITREQEPELFFEISELSVTESLNQHRRGSSFIIKTIVEFTPELKQYYPNVVDYDKYLGFWETNQYVADTEHGCDEKEIHTLTRVEKVEKTVVTTIWQPVKD
jgi:hypothetical protein